MNGENVALTTERLPKPSPDRALYQSILSDGFLVYPERKANYDLYATSQHSSHVDYFPIKLDIEPTSRCNFRCPMCLMSSWENGMRADDLSFDAFKEVVDAQTGLIELKLQGLGEPLLNRELFRMIDYARRRHIWVRTSTNASLLHQNENYRKLIDADICEVQVSVDGTTKEVYEAIRRGGQFDTIVENCRLLNEYGKKKEKDRMRMWVVLQKSNAHQLYDFPRFAAELGFSRLTIAPELTDWGQDEWAVRNKKIAADESLNAERLLAEAQKWGVEVTSWDVGLLYSFESDTTRCPWPFNRVFISSDTRITPCCKTCDPREVDLGNAQDFYAVWQGEAYRGLRASHLAGQVPDYCKSCYVSEDK